VLAVKRTPVYDPSNDHDDPNREPPPNARRISTTPTAAQIARRGEVRPLRTPTRRTPPRSGPDPRVWFIRGSIGVAALAGLWLGLQALFPMSESHVTQAPTPAQTQVIDANAVGAPEPPAAPPVAAQPQPTAVPTAAPAQEGDRLPGLPTPDPAAVAQAAPPAAAAAQPPAQAQPAAEQPQAQPTPIQPPAPEAAAEPAAAQPPAEPAAEQPQAEPAPSQPAAEEKPTLAPIPPPPAEPANAAVQQPAPAAKPQQSAPAPKPQAPAAAAPPPAAPSGGAFALAASASPANPVSEQAVVTVSVRATQGGAPLAGATCMASIHYRTATAKQPDGGFRTNANGVGSFTLDARNTTYGYYIPIDVTCTGRGGTASARTGFTPVKGR
jgi:hypothetical protein